MTSLLSGTLYDTTRLITTDENKRRKDKSALRTKSPPKCNQSLEYQQHDTHDDDKNYLLNVFYSRYDNNIN